MMFRKGQVSIEYLLAIAVVLIVLIFLLRPEGDFGQTVNSIVVNQSQGVRGTAGKIFN